jgi:hypothetical protein
VFALGADWFLAGNGEAVNGRRRTRRFALARLTEDPAKLARSLGERIGSVLLVHGLFHIPHEPHDGARGYRKIEKAKDDSCDGVPRPVRVWVVPFVQESENAQDERDRTEEQADNRDQSEYAAVVGGKSHAVAIRDNDRRGLARSAFPFFIIVIVVIVISRPLSRPTRTVVIIIIVVIIVVWHARTPEFVTISDSEFRRR